MWGGLGALCRCVCGGGRYVGVYVGGGGAGGDM